MSSRLIHIDIARGIGILLIVLGHNPILNAYSDLYYLIYSFHVPLFFFISGLFFKPSISFKHTLVGKGEGLLKPYFVTLFFVGIVYIFHKGHHPFSFVAGALYGCGETLVWEPLWFLPHLWLVYIFSWLVVRMTRFESRALYQKFVIFATLLVAGYFVLPLFWQTSVDRNIQAILRMQVLPGLPFSLDLILLSSFYFLFGFVFRTRVRRINFSFIPGIVVFVVLLWVHYFSGSTMDLNLRQYDHLIFSTVAAISGIYLVLVVSKILERIPGVRGLLVYVGSGSLFVLLFHGYLQGRSLMFLNHHFGTYPSLNAMIAFVFSIFLSLFIMEFVMRQRWLSFLFLISKQKTVQKHLLKKT